MDETKMCREGLLCSQYAVSTSTESPLTVIAIYFEVLRLVIVYLGNLL